MSGGAGGGVARVYPRVCGGTPAAPYARKSVTGLSPRVRGNRGAGGATAGEGGSIPACAGEPYGKWRKAATRWVYPRVCGGTCKSRVSLVIAAGLSPRVRGNPNPKPALTSQVRSIPACAGEPPAPGALAHRRWVYPRVCGGTGNAGGHLSPAAGLSPRVRGNLFSDRRGLTRVWSIPACAGEPSAYWDVSGGRGVYPRVCGGTGVIADGALIIAGLSPRVRGNQALFALLVSYAGSIPACAGEPCRPGDSAGSGWVYPRVCGGTPSNIWLGDPGEGLSPRVRGNPTESELAAAYAGSIPACAGEPAAAGRRGQASEVYPRVCGGTGAGRRPETVRQGLSPRVRGNRAHLRRSHARTGSIPACAGEP